MRARTARFLMEEERTKALLARAPVGRLGVQLGDGTPYVVPLNYVYMNDSIYIHSAPVGQKMESLRAYPAVCFEVDEMMGIRAGDSANKCNVGANYESAILFGTATELTDLEEKRDALEAFVDKYAPPHIKALDMPEASIKATSVVKVTVDSMTGKYSGEAPR